VDGIHTYNWGTYNNLISGLRQQGLHPLVEIRGIPDWALASGQPPCGLMHSTGLQAYSEFMAAIVERSDGDGVDDMGGSYIVRYWEIGNEVDKRASQGWSHYGLCYGENPNEYAQLLTRSWDAAHGADPDAQVVFGGLAYENCCDFNSDPLDQVSGPDFLDNVLDYIKNNPRSGGKKYFDVMNIHAYLWFLGNRGYDPPEVRTKYQIVQDKLVGCACGLEGVPLMNTESGRMSDNEVIWGMPTSLERQARYVPVLFVRSLAADLKAVFWYAMMDYGGLGYGLLTAANEPKKAYWAYKTLTEEMADFTYQRELTVTDTSSVDIEGHVFEGTSGREKWVVYLPPHKEEGGITTRQMNFPFSRIRRVEHEKYEGISGTPISGAVKEITDGDPDDLGPAGDGEITLQITLDPIYVEDISG